MYDGLIEFVKMIGCVAVVVMRIVDFNDDSRVREYDIRMNFVVFYECFNFKILCVNFVEYFVDVMLNFVNCWILSFCAELGTFVFVGDVIRDVKDEFFEWFFYRSEMCYVERV